MVHVYTLTLPRRGIKTKGITYIAQILPFVVFVIASGARTYTNWKDGLGG